MKRAELEKYLGKYVEITMFDNDVIKGELHKTTEFKNDRNLYLKPNYYILVMYQSVDSIAHSYLFRCSHVKKLREDIREGMTDLMAMTCIEEQIDNKLRTLNSLPEGARVSKKILKNEIVALRIGLYALKEKK